VILHVRSHVRFIGGGRQVKYRIEGEQLEVVMVDAAEVFGARSFVSVSTAIRNAFCASLRNMTDWYRCCRWGNVKNEPVDPGIRCCVAVFHDKNETFGLGGQLPKLEGRTDILSVASMRRGDISTIVKYWTGNKHKASFLGGQPK
jgi:hypothetical protein